MDALNKILLSSVLSGIITLCIGTSYIPSVGGTIPPDKSPQEFNDEQQQAVYNSTGFKVTMIGTGITVISILGLYIRSYIVDCKTECRSARSKVLRSILKVKRIHPQQVAPEPQIHPIEVIVDDPKPQVKTTPSLTAMVPAPSSSPPPQLIPRGPVIEKIPLPGSLRRTFKYPPPYDVMNG